MTARKLGLLLSTPPSHPSVETVVQLAQAALRRGVEVYLYLIDEGVKTSQITLDLALDTLVVELAGR